MNNILKILFISLFSILAFSIINNNSIRKENNDKKKEDIYLIVKERYRDRIVDISDPNRISASVSFLLKNTNYKELDSFILSLGFHEISSRYYCQGEQYLGFNFDNGLFYLNYFYPDNKCSQNFSKRSLHRQ